MSRLSAHLASSMSLLVTLRQADLGNWLAGVEKQTSGAARG